MVSRSKVRDGYREPRPENCSRSLYEVMLQCWHADPEARPSFEELYVELYDLLAEQDTPYS